MSRRRDRADRTVRPGQLEVRVCCTGGSKIDDQHERWTFGSIVVTYEREVYLNRLHVERSMILGQGNGKPTVNVSAGSASDGDFTAGTSTHHTYQLDCPRCSRRVPVTGDRLKEIGLNFATRGRLVYDISRPKPLES